MALVPDASKSEVELSDPRRQEIITQLIRSMTDSLRGPNSGPLSTMIPAHLLAFLWLADMKCLERFIEGQEENSVLVPSVSSLLPNMLATCMKPKNLL